MPAILQRTVCVMSTDKENNKLEETKVSEKGDVKEEVKKVETNDVENSTKVEKKDEAEVEESEPDKDEKEREKEKPAKPTSKKPAPKAKETKKKEAESDEDEDKEEDDEDEEGEDDKDTDESPAKSEKDGKGVPLLDQPLQQSGTRQRKVVERFNLKVDESAPIDIPEGCGVSLGSISVIEYNINKNKGDDLKKLHQLLFGRIAKATFIKKNIRKFNGFDFDDKSELYEKKKATIQKLELKGLKEISSILNLPAVGSRDELSTALMDFLMEPLAPSGAAAAKSPSTTSLTKGGRPKRVAAARAKDKGYSESEDEEDVKRRTPRTRRLKGKRPNLKDESSSEDEREKKSDDEDKASDEEMSVEETPSSDESDTEKAKKKRPTSKPAPKVTPKKLPAKKAAPPPKKAEKKVAPSKKKQESEDESSEDDEPLVKKSKTPPTDEEIKTFVKGILEGANLEEITMKTVCKQVYAHYPDFDLVHKKDFIKSTVKSLIST